MRFYTVSCVHLSLYVRYVYNWTVNPLTDTLRYIHHKVLHVFFNSLLYIQFVFFPAYHLVGYFGGYIIFTYFGEFWKFTKIKITKFKLSYVDFGDYFFIFFFQSWWAWYKKKHDCYMHTVLLIQNDVHLLIIDTKLNEWKYIPTKHLYKLCST